ncbi:hypothetical protein EDD22DRAFT_592347 [Suillus occidentalis]|nr:hypothetical protein EDD22DRAFT_592347 [Suillus occidentalis]
MAFFISFYIVILRNPGPMCKSSLSVTFVPNAVSTDKYVDPIYMRMADENQDSRELNTAARIRTSRSLCASERSFHWYPFVWLWTLFIASQIRRSAVLVERDTGWLGFRIFPPDHRCYFRPINVSPSLRSIAFSMLQALKLCFTNRSHPRPCMQLQHSPSPVPLVVLSTIHTSTVHTSTTLRYKNRSLSMLSSITITLLLYHHYTTPLHNCNVQNLVDHHPL